LKKSDLPKPPKHLSREAKGWWAKFSGEWILDDAAQLILATALEAFDRMRGAQKLIADKGAVFEDRFGQLRPNPATTIERDARAALLGALKSLHLDFEPIQGTGRPQEGK
jgi:P27 family predicted phage terminase small subunit